MSEAEEPVAEINEMPAEELPVDEAEAEAEEDLVEGIAVPEAEALVEDILAEAKEEAPAAAEVEVAAVEETVAEIEQEESEEEFPIDEDEPVAEEVLEVDTAVEEAVAEIEAEKDMVISEAEAIVEEPVAETTPGNGNGNGNGSSHKDALANATVWGEMGNIFFSEAILDGALIAYKKALELDDNYGAVMHNLALLYMQKGEFSEAVKLYEQSIAYLDDNAQRIKIWNNIGNAYRAMRNYQQAEEAYRKADELDTENITLENWTRQELLSTDKV